MQGVYRNLNSRTPADIWTVTNAHVSAKGHLVIDKGVTHDVNFSISGTIFTTNPSSIQTGCKRIRSKGWREVVAIIGGTIDHAKPCGTYIGRLTLNLDAGGFQLITESGRQPFDGQNVAVWFGSNSADVYSA